MILGPYIILCSYIILWPYIVLWSYIMLWSYENAAGNYLPPFRVGLYYDLKEI